MHLRACCIGQCKIIHSRGSIEITDARHAAVRRRCVVRPARPNRQLLCRKRLGIYLRWTPAETFSVTSRATDNGTALVVMEANCTWVRVREAPPAALGMVMVILKKSGKQ